MFIYGRERGKLIGFRQWVVHNELVPVYETSTGEKVVYGTELHKALQVKSRYTDWVRNRLFDCDAVENEDFELCFPKLENKMRGGQNKKDHIIKLDTAKEMAMLERNKKGKEVRQYFIKFLGICQEKACCHMDGYTGMDKRTFSNTYKTI